MTFWAVPEGGKVPDLADMLQAETLSEMQAVSAPMAMAALVGLEAERDLAEAEARAIAADLAKKGVRFDVERALRPSLLERLQDWWWDLRDSREETDDQAQVSDREIFAVAVQVAQSRPTRDVAMEYEAQDIEVARFTDALARQISAQRGQLGWRVDIPDAVLDAALEKDDPSDTEAILAEADQIIAYWPPHGQPAVMLSVSQEDGGLPIMVQLVAHGVAAHHRFVALLEGAGGALRQSDE